MKRIAHFLIQPPTPNPQPPTPNPQPPTPNPQPLTPKTSSIFSIQRRFQLIRTNLGIMNDHEPFSSTDPPSPPGATWYKGDDFIYHRVNGLWKRTTLSKFNNHGTHENL
ncbi:MAG: hypothetical protein LWX09_12565 [Bacteroidia bacterium]|nr:hypothetical protein [Bacteroidia bacterium]